METSNLIQNEASIRLVAFTSIFAAVAIFEWLLPRRSLRIAKAYRWFNNLALVAINTVVLRLAFPAAAVGVAVWAENQGWGLFNAGWLGTLPELLVICICIVLLDLAIWYQHLLFHKVPWLWRLHRVHHADPDFDLTTGLRFHPIEILLSMLIKSVLIISIGVPVAAVILFEIILSGTAMITHGNFKLPSSLDRLVRFVFVTPDMHRVHHSWRREETDSNYGFNLSIWDRLFGTYRQDSVDGQSGIQFGIQSRLNPNAIPFYKLLTLPFRNRL